MINGLDLMSIRLASQGGPEQQARMIKDKKRTLDKAIMYSYQGARVQRSGDLEAAPALINPNKVLQDYDDKILSIGYEYGYQPGDVFEWTNTGTKWIIYLQDLTELAYFKGNIRRCSYEISWEDENGNKLTTYAAIRGPQESGINSIQRGSFNMDLPNHAIHLLLPSNEANLEQFQRYTKFYLQGLAGAAAKVCWRVEGVDTISTPGIIGVYAEEYYANNDVDDIENGIVGGLIPEEVPSDISGETFIKPRKVYTFTYVGSEIASWEYDNTLPMEVNIDDKQIHIAWNTNYGGQFVLKYGTTEKTVVVNSLF